MSKATEYGNIIQFVSLVMVGLGIAMELILKADFGYLFITVGAVILAVGTKVKYWRRG